MHSTGFSRDFLIILKFPQIKEGILFYSGVPILQSNWIIWSPLLHFNFENVKDANSTSFIWFSCIVDDLAVLFSVFQNFFKLKRADLIPWMSPLLHNNWIIWFPLLYFKFLKLKEANSTSFTSIPCILHDLAVLS